MKTDYVTSWKVKDERDQNTDDEGAIESEKNVVNTSIEQYTLFIGCTCF